MPSDLTFRFLNAVHGFLLRVSRGRIGGRLVGMPVIELTTTGRKSGEAHTVLLTTPVQQGDSYVVVASRGGDDQAPAWLLNLRADPNVEVSIAGAARQPWIATEATDQERAALWPAVVAKYRHYGAYQKRTSRRIPLVLLKPLPRQGKEE